MTLHRVHALHTAAGWTGLDGWDGPNQAAKPNQDPSRCNVTATELSSFPVHTDTHRLVWALIPTTPVLVLLSKLETALPMARGVT